MSKSLKIFLIFSIGIVLFTTRFLFLGSNDLLSDDALYSFRALGWLDFIGGGQTTPIQWFNNIPWWANLSFHDGPPLVPFFQYTFFSIFGDSAFVARLPFALASIGTVILIYFILKDYLKNEYLAFLGAGLATVSSYLTWAGRVGYLEGVQIFFITLSLFLFLRYVLRQDNRYLYAWGVSVGLALMSKYTALFILPAVFFYFLMWDRKVFFKKDIWLAGVLALIVLTPVIIYNFNIFTTRGHFDAALSSMVGMSHEDFSTVADRSANLSITNLQSLFKVFWQNLSIPFFILLLVGVIYSFYLWYKNKDQWYGVTLLYLIFGILLFVPMGPGSRFLSVLMPFLVILSIVFISHIFKYFRKNNFYLAGAVLLFVLVFVGEFLFSVNTNLLAKPIGNSSLYSKSRFYNHGFNQLDDYMKKEIGSDNLKAVRPKNLQAPSRSSLVGNDFWLFDERIDWFSYSWYLQKYIFYYRLPMMSSYNYLSALSEEDRQDIFEHLKKNRFDGVYYIYAVSDKVLDRKKKESNELMGLMREVANIFESNNAIVTVIKNNQGEIAFKVYYLPLR